MKMEPLIHPFQAVSCPQAWLQGVEYLLSVPKRQAYNLVLAVESPVELLPNDQKACKLVDKFLRRHDEDPLSTVAGTIFPANHYLRYGTEGVYERFPKGFEKVQLQTWGTYAMRMLRRVGKDGTIMNPLKTMVEKINKHRHLIHSGFEINVADDGGDTGELATYTFKRDANRTIQQPCLSHLTFKVAPGDILRLTVMYRSHYYITKALGNLLGLAQLQSFVAEETGLSIGPLVCYSTHARIDVALGEVKALVAQIKPLLTES
jgi:hypothetical protein